MVKRAPVWTTAPATRRGLVAVSSCQEMLELCNSHASRDVGKQLCHEDHDDTNSRIDRCEREGVHGSEALKEDGAINTDKVLTRQLEEDVDADANQRSL